MNNYTPFLNPGFVLRVYSNPQVPVFSLLIHVIVFPWNSFFLVLYSVSINSAWKGLILKSLEKVIRFWLTSTVWIFKKEINFVEFFGSQLVFQLFTIPARWLDQGINLEPILRNVIWPVYYFVYTLTQITPFANNDHFHPQCPFTSWLPPYSSSVCTVVHIVGCPVVCNFISC